MSVCVPLAEGEAVDVFAVDPALYRGHRAKLLQKLRPTAAPHSVVLLQGGRDPQRYDTDFEPVFRQESNFAYLTGVKEPEVYAVIEVESGKTTLFFPQLPESYAIFMGDIRDATSFREEYEVDEVKWVPELLDHLVALDPTVVYTTRGRNADSGRYATEASFPGIENFRVDNGLLYNAIVACRVIKSPLELDLLRHINKISSQAHCWVMSQAQPGMREFQLESMFQHWGYFRGMCRHQSYTSICGCGSHGSILHYGHAGAPNDGTLVDGDMALLDMGAEYKCYTSDITCSFPIGGRFTADQRLIYETVLDAQWTVMRAMRPGVSYIDMHTLAYKVILENLLRGGLLQGGTVEEMQAVNLGAVFMPHGLGHFMGLDTHDVGGRPQGHPQQTLDGYKSLRCCVTLQEGMVLTVEPGVYFNTFALATAAANPAQARFLQMDTIERFRSFGGVRLEDDVVVTADGIENLTRCPRTVADVEAVMAGDKDSSSRFTTYAD